MARFVVGFGNRGFFPPKYMSEARSEISTRLSGLGHEVLMSSDTLTRLGAVETAAEGKQWADWLDGQNGRYDGIIWTHPNFGDESGMLPALRKAGKRGDRILIHAYPDRMDQLGLADRRDAFLRRHLHDGRAHPIRDSVHQARARTWLPPPARASRRTWPCSRKSAGKRPPTPLCRQGPCRPRAAKTFSTG